MRTRMDVQSLHEIISRSYLPPPRNLASFAQSQSQQSQSQQSQSEQSQSQQGTSGVGVAQKAESPEKEAASAGFAGGTGSDDGVLVALGERLLHSTHKALAIGDD